MVANSDPQTLETLRELRKLDIQQEELRKHQAILAQKSQALQQRIGHSLVVCWCALIAPI